MHTFSLTAVSARSGLNTVQKKPTDTIHKRPAPRIGSSLEASGPFTKNIQLLKNSISYYKKKNADIKNTIDLLNGAMETMDDRRELFKRFDKELVSIYERLDQRFAELANAEGKVKSFRQTPEGISSSTKLETKGTGKRNDLLAENEKLVQLALAQERTIIVMKMKLRLCHDHRDLSHLRRILNKLEGGGSDYKEDEEITGKMKSQIHILRDSIQKERDRIRFLQLDGTSNHDAATVIQKTWRGFIYRFKTRPKVEETPPNNQTTTPRSKTEEEEEVGETERPDITPAPANEE